MALLKINYNFVPFPKSIWDENLDLTLAEFRLLGYLLKNLYFGQPQIPISDEELMNGKISPKGARIDHGCGLSSRNGIKFAREALTKRGWLQATNKSTDITRTQWVYSLKFEEDECVTERHSMSQNDTRVSHNDNAVSQNDTPYKEVEESTKKITEEKQPPSLFELKPPNQETLKGNKRNQEPPELPAWLPQDEWFGWLEMRKKRRNPATNYAQRIAIDDLDALRQSGENLREAMRVAIVKGWLKFYPVSTQWNNGNSKATSPEPEDALARERREEAERKQRRLQK